jgi:hypothetical protein
MCKILAATAVAASWMVVAACTVQSVLIQVDSIAQPWQSAGTSTENYV